MKICTKCKHERPASAFAKVYDKRREPGTLASSCIECNRGRIYAKARRSYARNATKTIARVRAYREANQDKARAAIKSWKARNHYAVQAGRERYRRKKGMLGPKHEAHVVAWRAECQRRAQSGSTRSRYFVGPRLPSDNTAEGYRWRYANDADFRLNECLRRQLCKKGENVPGFAESVRSAMLRSGHSNLVETVIGCTVPELRAHLARQFAPGMSWENYGKHGWHIDHILPKRCFDISTEDGFQAYWSLSNLRPLAAKANIAKSDKVLFLV
jgi:hypothetical protein